MDLREILKEAGLEDKAIKQILTNMKAEKIYTTSEENADIRIRKFKEKIENLETDITEKTDKLDSLKNLETERDTFKNQVETMKKEASDKDFNSAIDAALISAKSKNNKLVKALLEKEKITYKDGKIEGLDEQLSNIRKENDFLFEKEIKGAPDFTTGGNDKNDKNDKKEIGEILAENKKQSVDLSKYF